MKETIAYLVVLYSIPFRYLFTFCLPSILDGMGHCRYKLSKKPYSELFYNIVIISIYVPAINLLFATIFVMLNH